MASALSVAALAETQPAKSEASPPEPPGQAKRFDQAKALRELEARIAGHESEPAEKIFKDIQLLKGVPAQRLLRIMQVGYARSLGVNCTHCHVAGAWEKDTEDKLVAREMMRITKTLNEELLPKIAKLESDRKPEDPPVVNCTTCHRGQLKPALELPGQRADRLRRR